MIKNDKQLSITKKLLQDFENTVAKVKLENIDPIEKRVQLNALRNDINEFQKEIEEYTNLKEKKTSTLVIPEFRLCYEALIKARIAKGWTQAELAEKIGVKEQQIQRYEATDYSTASIPRIDEIIYVLGINMSLYITGLTKMRFELPDGYSPDLVRTAQIKASSQKSLLVN